MLVRSLHAFSDESSHPMSLSSGVTMVTVFYLIDRLSRTIFIVPMLRTADQRRQGVEPRSELLFEESQYLVRYSVVQYDGYCRVPWSQYLIIQVLCHTTSTSILITYNYVYMCKLVTP